VNLFAADFDGHDNSKEQASSILSINAGDQKKKKRKKKDKVAVQKMSAAGPNEFEDADYTIKPRRRAPQTQEAQSMEANSQLDFQEQPPGSLNSRDTSKSRVRSSNSRSGRDASHDRSQKNTSSDPSTASYLLPAINPTQYISFLDQFIFGTARKPSLTRPIPPTVGQIKFLVRRNKSGLNKLTPHFQLMIEKIDGGTLLVLYAKKMAFKQSSYYLISLDKSTGNLRQSSNVTEFNQCVGKLRAVDGQKNQFVLYDNGENFVNTEARPEELRVEHGAFKFSYVPCNVGNIRKVCCLFPTVREVSTASASSPSAKRPVSVDTRYSDRPASDQRGGSRPTAQSTEGNSQTRGVSERQERGLEDDVKVKGQRV